MNHLSHEDLILAYYGDPAAANARDHAESCDTCRAELASIAAVLDRVPIEPAPNPGDDYEARVWQRLQWRLRGEKIKERRIAPKWMAWTAAAAMAGAAVCTGVVWAPRKDGKVRQEARIETTGAAQPVNNTPRNAAPGRDRILLVVVGDHFDESERVLVELANLTPSDGLDLRSERARAEGLLASNRLYRTTASERGEDQVATVLSDLEPVLLQLAHSPDEVSADELRSIQKRIESRGLVFKLRVAKTGARENAKALPKTTI